MDAAPRREMEKIYTSKDVHIPHSELVRLRQENRVSLGISELAADQIGVLSRLQPTKTTAAAAFRFWNIVLLAALVYSIYLSFTSAWWWFFVGIAVGLIIAKANSEESTQPLRRRNGRPRILREGCSLGWLVFQDVSRGRRAIPH